MDIIIMLLLTLVAGLMLGGASRRVIIPTWFLTALLIAGLFKHHVTSALGLSF